MQGKGGPYGEASAMVGITFRSSVAMNEEDDIHIFGNPNAELRGFFPGMSTAPIPQNGWGWSVVKMQVDSPTGTVHLRSNDPREAPIINFNFFEENRLRDLQAMAEATELLLKTMNSVGQPFAPYQVVDPTQPEDLSQSILDNAYSHHASCSCRMGPKNDPNYCVDSNFKVNGVENLRIVDASVFPRPMGSFPLSSVYTMSHKAFKTILADVTN
jgi:choline dehydrogenase